ncbi:MAG: transketolase C-terminal domain-containing protein [Bacteroidota bacterium]
MRTAFIQQLIEEARKNEKIFLITGDLGFSVLEPFANEFPDRFLNAGVAEQNMTGLAAGLAMEGYTVFTYSIANFPTLRPMEQIRYDVAYHNLNVKVVAVGGGYAYASLGASHHATEELGMIRTIPNMVVCAPGDPAEARAITTALTKHKGPAYIRLGKAGEPKVHTSLDSIRVGEAICVRKGQRTAVLTTGAMLMYAFEHKENKEKNYSLYSFPFVKPIDSATLRDIAKTHSNIITLEEHQRSAGFGSAVLECLHDLQESGEIDTIPNVKRIAIPDQFVSVAGTQEYLRSLSGLNM